MLHLHDHSAISGAQKLGSRKMDNEKERQSGEQERDGPADPILPTVNPVVSASEKAEAAKGGIHPAFYIAYVCRTAEWERCLC